MEDNNEVEDNDEDDNNFKDISAVGLDGELIIFEIYGKDLCGPKEA